MLDVDSADLNLRYTKKYNGINAITEQINPQVNNNHLDFIWYIQKTNFINFLKKGAYNIYSKFRRIDS